VDRRAAGTCCDAGLAQDGHRPTLSQHAFERTQLGIDMGDRCQLGEDQRVVALSEAVQVEDEAPEIAIAELARFAQKTRAPSGATPRAKACELGNRSGACRRLLLRQLCCGV
jgi:hypothetical protein